MNDTNQKDTLYLAQMLQVIKKQNKLNAFLFVLNGQ